MKGKPNDFLEVITSNDEEKMRKYLLQNGKKPKPISPFEFSISKDEIDLSNNKED